MVKIPAIIAILICTLLALTGVALAANPIKLIVNGQEIKPAVLPQISKGATMVPVRWVAEALGAEVNWDSKGKQVIINQPEEIWPGEFEVSYSEWMDIRATVDEFLLAWDNPSEAARERYNNVVADDAVIYGGNTIKGEFHGWDRDLTIVNWKFIDARWLEDTSAQVVVEIIENAPNKWPRKFTWFLTVKGDKITGIEFGKETKLALEDIKLFKGFSIGQP